MLVLIIKKLVTQRFLNQSQTKFEDLTPKQQELFNKGELYVVRIKAEKLGKDRFRLKNVFGSSDEIDILEEIYSRGFNQFT